MAAFGGGADITNWSRPVRMGCDADPVARLRTLCPTLGKDSSGLWVAASSSAYVISISKGLSEKMTDEQFNSLLRGIKAKSISVDRFREHAPE
jgi:hypothetical protein